MNELSIVDNKTIVLEDSKKVRTIKNKEQYKKMVLNCNPKIRLLNGFINIEELELGRYFCSEYTNKLPFKDNIKKLFMDRKEIGDSWYDNPIQMRNLESIEFTSRLKIISENYLNYLIKLENLIFNVDHNTDIKFNGNHKGLEVNSTNLKQIIIKAPYDEYIDNVDYKAGNINVLKYSDEEGIILEYSNGYIKTKITIKNDCLIKTNKLYKISDDFIENECFIIPNYINSIDLDGISYTKKIESISLNLYTLLSDKNIFTFIGKYIPDLKKIIIRKNNEMSLFENIEITTLEYGEFKDIYIMGKELIIEFSDKKMKIDSNGNKCIYDLDKSRKVVSKIIEDNKLSITNSKYDKLNSFNTTELEYYTYYKKLIEYIINDDMSEKENIETKRAMNVIEKQLIKKLERDN